MPDPSLGEWIVNDLVQAVVEWFVRGWWEAPRTAQIAVAAAILLGLVVLLLGLLAYPGVFAVIAIGCGMISMVLGVLIVFTIAVIRGE